MSTKFVKALSDKGNAVLYISDDKRRFILSGGSRSWRNNNPGNLRPGKFSKRNGAIGEAGGLQFFQILSKGVTRWLNY